MTRYVIALPRPKSKEHGSGGTAQLALTLSQALTREWRTDAHFQPLECVMHEDTAPHEAVRVTRGLLEDGTLERVAITHLVVDVDGPGHKATRKWRRREERKLLALAEGAPGFWFFETRGGYRLIWPLAERVWIRSESEAQDAEAWRRFYLSVVQWLSAEYQIAADETCTDYPRIYRLPNVRRDREDQRSEAVRAGRGTWPIERSLKYLPAERTIDADSGDATKAQSTDWPSQDAHEEWINTLADLMAPAWEVERQSWALAFFGWVGRWMPEDELFELVHALEDRTSIGNEQKFLNMAERAEPSRVGGPSAAIRDALGDAFADVDAHLATHPNARSGGEGPLHRDNEIAELDAKIAALQKLARERYRERRKKERKARADAIGADLEVPEREPKPLLYRGSSGWVVDGKGNESPYRGRVLPHVQTFASRSDAIDELCRDELRASTLGIMKGPHVPHDATVIRNIAGENVEHIRRDFACAARGLYDPDTRTIVEGYPLPEIKGRFNAEIDAWARRAFGAAYDAVAEWIAGTAQRYIDRPAACFVFVGPHSIGKSVFFRALGYLWTGRPEFVRLKGAIDRFNGTVARSPIWCDDEAQSQSAKRYTAALGASEFRELTQDRERDVEPKGQEKYVLEGACRLAITANDIEDLNLAGVRGIEAFRAMKERLLVRVVPAEDEDEIKALLEAWPRDENGNFDWLQVAEHFRWIQEQHEAIPNDGAHRFIGRGGDVAAADRIIASGSTTRHPEVFERIAEWANDKSPVSRTKERGCLVVARVRDKRGGYTPTVCVHARSLADKAGVDLQDALQAIGPFVGAGSVRVRVGDAVTRYKPLDIHALAAACGISEKAIARRLRTCEDPDSEAK